MIFNICRTKDFVFSENNPPCNKAFIKEFERPGWGNKYKIVQSKGWFIELNTLEDLLNLKEEVGEPIIIDDDPWKDNNVGVEYSIEIYDNYRE